MRVIEDGLSIHKCLGQIRLFQTKCHFGNLHIKLLGGHFLEHILYSKIQANSNNQLVFFNICMKQYMAQNNIKITILMNNNGLYNHKINNIDFYNHYLIFMIFFFSDSVCLPLHILYFLRVQIILSFLFVIPMVKKYLLIYHFL